MNTNQLNTDVKQQKDKAIESVVVKGDLNPFNLSQAVDDLTSSLVQGSLPVETLRKIVKEGEKVNLHSPNKLSDLSDWLVEKSKEKTVTLSIVNTPNPLPSVKINDSNSQINEVIEIINGIIEKVSNLTDVVKELTRVSNILKDIAYENN